MSNLIKKAQLIKKFSWTGWNIARSIHELYNACKIKLVDDESWHFTDYWTTYEDCIHGFVSVNDDDIKIQVECFNGDLVNGQPISPRWIAVFSGNLEILKMFKSVIDYNWSIYLDVQFQKEEMERKQNRIREIESRLLA